MLLLCLCGFLLLTLCVLDKLCKVCFSMSFGLHNLLELFFLNTFQLCHCHFFKGGQGIGKMVVDTIFGGWLSIFSLHACNFRLPSSKPIFITALLVCSLLSCQIIALHQSHLFIERWKYLLKSSFLFSTPMTKGI